jgi:hypothetical protein
MANGRVRHAHVITETTDSLDRPGKSALHPLSGLIARRFRRFTRFRPDINLQGHQSRLKSLFTLIAPLALFTVTEKAIARSSLKPAELC